MQELTGTPRNPGIAMAVAIVIDANGFPNIPDDMLTLGMKAVKAGRLESDFAEVVVACNSLGIGSAMRFPGIKIIGIVSEKNDQPGLPITVPCVSEVENAAKTIGAGSIVIVDGNEGVVIANPDAATVARYQKVCNPYRNDRVFIEWPHASARTQDGRLVTVSALVSSVEDAEQALSLGADRIALHLTSTAEPVAGLRQLSHTECFQTVLALAGGKPITLYLDSSESEILDLAAKYGAPGQVTIVEGATAIEVLNLEQVTQFVAAGAESVMVQSADIPQAKDIIRSDPGEHGVG